MGAPVYDPRHEQGRHGRRVGPVTGFCRRAAAAIAGYIAAVIALSGILMLRIAKADRALREKLEVQAWHLRHLVPVQRRGS